MVLRYVKLSSRALAAAARMGDALGTIPGPTNAIFVSTADMEVTVAIILSSHKSRVETKAGGKARRISGDYRHHRLSIPMLLQRVSLAARAMLLRNCLRLLIQVRHLQAVPVFHIQALHQILFQALQFQLQAGHQALIQSLPFWPDSPWARLV